MRNSSLCLTLAQPTDRAKIYAIRHAIYATELGQHSVNAAQQLTDSLDLLNHYIIAKQGEQVVGFVSITPPAAGRFSVDKYFDRSAVPYPFDDSLYEVRLLTVVTENRASHVALALMYAVFRWIQAHSGQHIVAICRTDLLAMYQKAGLRPLCIQTVSGQVTYELSVTTITELQQVVQRNWPVYQSLQQKLDWQFPFPYVTPSACFHGGQFFRSVGEDLQTLHRAKQIINADVLDAWFPPSPHVLTVLQAHLAWLLQTSPPTQATGLTRTIAHARSVPETCVLPGAGSSDLIFLALRNFLTRSSHVLLLDPSYGEYAHVLEKVIGCQVSRFTLYRETGFRVNTAALLTEIQRGYDLVILVNPNNPTGVHVPKPDMVRLLEQVPDSTLVWVDETYIDYVDAAESLESFAVGRENVFICKSMSKAYALSGVRAAYLCSSPHLLETLRSLTPPWAVSLPAQAAAIAALNDPDYYQYHYAETHRLRARLKQELQALGVTDIIDGVANYLLFYLPPTWPDISNFLTACQQHELFLRDVRNMGTSLGERAVRIAVKDDETIDRMVYILKHLTVLTTSIDNRTVLV